MSWDDMMESDYIFKSHAVKHVVQINGKELGGIDSTILIYYNVYNGMPMLLVQRFNKTVDIELPEIDGYVSTYIRGDDIDEEEFTEITYILTAIKNAV